MLWLRRPSQEVIDGELRRVAPLPYSYDAVGATRDNASPPGFLALETRAHLGAGRATFQRACQALRNWRMVRLAWLEVYPQGAPLEPGTTLGLFSRHLGIWTLNPSRIIYVIDEDAADAARYGFAYGTLPGHGLAGEELFLLEHTRRDDAVAFTIRSFSRPCIFLSRIGILYVRRLQQRFLRDSLAAITRAVREP